MAHWRERPTLAEGPCKRRGKVVMIALVLTLCTYAACNDYFIATDDSWQEPKDCTGSMWLEYDKMESLGVDGYLHSRSLQAEISYAPIWELSCRIVDQELIP